MSRRQASEKSSNGSQGITSANAPTAFRLSSVTGGTASAYSYGAGSGYRQDGVAPAGLPNSYALQKVGARYYDPAVGGFLTRDTDLSQSPYAYCDGDPVNCTDPSGHKAKTPPTYPPTTPPTVPPVSPNIPIGNSGGTYNPTAGGGTATTPPVSTGSGGVVTGTIGGLNSGHPTSYGADGVQPLFGGTLNLNGKYNPVTGTFTGGASYNHPLGGGFSGGVSVGSGQEPVYSLKFTLGLD